MSEFRDQALEKLRKEAVAVSGSKERAMSEAVRATLENFAGQEEEFAQAIVQGGSFSDCMTAVAKGVGGHISDLEAYKKAVQFYFPGAEIRMQMTIDLIGDAAKDPEPYTPKHASNTKPENIVLDFTEFL
ncbi:MAG: hypothetical protein IJ110_10220 [Lachnospiraceae bacterium]|nr:hypothetical protein [Lachnospiraceae bacterium]MBQ9029127.1 hypothetical protein [Lachnospiraceae bacterium]